MFLKCFLKFILRKCSLCLENIEHAILENIEEIRISKKKI